MLLFDRACAGA